MKHFGAVFKDIRESRNIKLKDLAGSEKEISIAQLSKFENGKSDITLQKLYPLLEQLGITLQEFEYAANGYKLNRLHTLFDKISKLYNENNQRGLERLLEIEKGKVCDGGGIRKEINALIIKGALKEIDRDVVFTDGEKAFLLDYLNSIEEWGYYELRLYNITMGILDLSTIEDLTSDIVKRASVYRGVGLNEELVKTIVLNTVMATVSKKDFKKAIYFKNILSDLMKDETDIFTRALLSFVTGEMEFYQGEEKSGKVKMQNAIKIFEMVESNNLVDSYAIHYKRITGEKYEFSNMKKN